MSSVSTADSAGMTAKLARFVERATFADLPLATIENAKLAILDTLACALAASRFPVGTIMIDHVRETGAPGRATVWPAGYRTAPSLAAWANGHLANAVDYDISLHLDTHVAPAAFAVAEQQRVDGRSFLAAYIAGREVGARLMKALDGQRVKGRGVSHRGWWHVGLVAPLDAAAVAARLLGLDDGGIATAMGIASVSAGGFRRNLGTMAKSLGSAKGARDGVDAAFLARRGFTAEPAILEAPMGLIETLCPAGEFDSDALLSGLGTHYELEAAPKCKPFPACGPANPQIDALLELQRAEHLDPLQVERVVANFHSHSLLRPQARDQIEAGFSTPYVIAVTLTDAAFGLRQLGNDRVQDPAVRALMERIANDPEAPDGRVTVTMRDGRTLVTETTTRRVLSNWDEVATKFDESAETCMSSGAAGEVKDALARLESAADVSEIMGILYSGTTATSVRSRIVADAASGSANEKN